MEPNNGALVQMIFLFKQVIFLFFISSTIESHIIVTDSAPSLEVPEELSGEVARDATCCEHSCDIL